MTVRKNDRAVLLKRIAMWFNSAWHWDICKAFQALDLDFSS